MAKRSIISSSTSHQSRSTNSVENGLALRSHSLTDPNKQSGSSPTPDFEVQNHGSIFLLIPQTCPLVFGLTNTSAEITAINPATQPSLSNMASSLTSSPEFKTTDWRCNCEHEWNHPRSTGEETLPKC
jgi:hypothetical protein